MSKETNDGDVRAKVFVIVVLIGLICFLMWNFGTSWSFLKWMLGDTNEVLALAVAVTLVDVAGLARLFTPAQKMRDEGLFVWLLGFVWILSLVADIVLTYYFVVFWVYDVNPVIPPNAVEVYTLFPWAVAIIEVGIRVPLVLLVGSYGDRMLHPDKEPVYHQTPTSTPIRKRPQPVPASSTAYKQKPYTKKRSEPAFHPVVSKGGLYDPDR